MPEASATSSTDLFRAVFDQSAIGSLVLTPVETGLEVVAANRAAGALLGLDLDDLLGRTSSDASHERDRVRILEAAHRLIDESLTSWETELALRNTPVGWVRLVLTALPSVEGRPMLLGQVHELDAVDRLEALDRAKSDFVSSVSHELRTPLTTVMGFTEVLLSGAAGELTERQASMLLRVEQNGGRLLSLIEDLLLLSDIEAGSFRMERSEVDLVGVVQRALAAIEPILVGRELGVELDPAQATVRVPGDTDQLERVVAKLLTNAVNFTPDGGRVTVRVEREHDGGAVHVSDTGLGVPVVEQEHLFTRFFRSSTAYDRAVPGTGLGLSIVKPIVDGHGGSVNFESAPECGSRFSVRLPTR